MKLLHGYNAKQVALDNKIQSTYKNSNMVSEADKKSGQKRRPNLLDVTNGIYI
jgi:hypothetical protein